MKLLIGLLFVFTTTIVSGKNIYISSVSGNDGNTGLSTSQAWKTIPRLNTGFSIMVAGDSILFDRGGTYYGKLIFTKGSIAIGYYGTGAKPVITGLTTLTTWTTAGGNIWTSVPSVRPRKLVNILTINGVPQEIGRTDYMPFTSATSNTVTAPTISATNVGQILVIRKNAYILEPGLVTSVTGTTATYKQVMPTLEPTGSTNFGAYVTPVNSKTGTSGYSYFIERNLSTLDKQNEWYYDSVANKVSLYSTSNPNSSTIKISTLDTVVYCNNYTNMSINGINIEGANLYGFFSRGGNNITIANCDFNTNMCAYTLYQSANALVDHNNFNNSISNSGFIRNTTRVATITVTNNNVLNNGLLYANGMSYSDFDLKAFHITNDTTSFKSINSQLTISDNTFLNIGFAAIIFQGSNALVSHNYINNYSEWLGDNGSIYTYYTHDVLNAPIIYYNRIIEWNITLNSTGGPLGAPGPDVGVYYLDDQTTNVIVRYNTGANVAGTGLQLNNPINQQWYGNTIYNCSLGISVNKKWFNEIYNVTLRRNIIYQKDTSQFYYIFTNSDTTSPSKITILQSLKLVSIDSGFNTNLRPKSYDYYYSGNRNATTIFAATPLGTGITKATFDSKSTNYIDQHSKQPPVAYTGANSRIIANPSYTPLITSFPGLKWITPDSVVHLNSDTIPAWSSRIYIDNGTTNQPPIARAGVDIVNTLPNDSVSVNGSGSTDADGTIVSYLWTKLTGTGETIVNPTSVTTKILHLTKGTHSFELKVTDNNGATNRDTLIVTINPAPNLPPVVTIGADQTITLPLDSVLLTATATDPNSDPMTYSWTLLSGSGSTIVSPTSLTTRVRGLTAGTRVYRFTATDTAGASMSKVVQIIVNATVPTNMPPTANAGSNQILFLPHDTTTLNGSGTDPEGGRITYSWSKISGPSMTISSINTASTQIICPTVGIYIVQLTTTDSLGATGTSLVQIEVRIPAAILNVILPPIITITLPVDTVNVTAVINSTLSITSYKWRKVASTNIGGDILVDNGINVRIMNFRVGSYTYQLTVVNSVGTTAIATMIVNVRPKKLSHILRGHKFVYNR